MPDDVKPIEGEIAGHGGNGSIGATFGDTAARIGTFNPSKVGFKTFAEMRRHFQVGAGTDLVAMPLMSMPWSVEGDPLIAGYVQAVTKPIFSRMMRTAAEAVLVGCAPHEVVWERRDTQVVDAEHAIDQTVTGWAPRKIKDIDPGSLTNILVDGLEEFAGYTLTVPPNGKLPAEKAFHVCHDGRYGNMWGEGRLRRAYEPWYRFMVIWDQAVRYMEKLATPPTIVYYVPGKSEDGTQNRDAALDVGAGITGEETHVAMPLSRNESGTWEKAWDIDLLRDDQRGNMYLGMLEAHSKWMLRALLIPDTVFAQNAATGSLALSQTHADTYTDSVERIGRDIIDAYNVQVVPRIVRYTFGPDAPVPMLTTGGLTDEVRGFYAELLKAVLTTSGVNIAWDKVADRLDVPLVQEEDGGGELAQARKDILALAETARTSKLMLMAHV